MKTQHIPKIGLIIEITREFGRGLCRGISELARETNAFAPFLIDARMLQHAEDLRAYDGFVARVMNDRMADVLSATGRPVIDVYYDRPRDGFAIVKTNHSKIGTLAADLFLGRRFTNFAYCGFSGGRFSTYCRAAFVRALSKHGQRCVTYVPPGKARYDFNAQVLINEQLKSAPDAKSLWQWLNRLAKPVAVFCPNDLRAWQLLQVCRQHVVSVPHDVAILGLDNDVLVCGLANPMISSIDPDTEAIGRCAATTLLEMIANPALARRNVVREVAPKGVIVRASTETYPLEPAWLSDALVFIERHIGENLSAADVYRHVGHSHTQVDRIFREKLGHSVQAEISGMRLEKAQQLLRSTPLPVKEIAPLCGFSTAQYFIKSFTGAFGRSPSAWRETTS